MGKDQYPRGSSMSKGGGGVVNIQGEGNVGGGVNIQGEGNVQGGGRTNVQGEVQCPRGGGVNVHKGVNTQGMGVNIQGEGHNAPPQSSPPQRGGGSMIQIW